MVGVLLEVASGRIELPSQGRKPRVLPLNDEAGKMQTECDFSTRGSIFG